MAKPRSAAALTVASIGLAVVVGWSAGCGTAQAEPLDVTYYYLPG